MTRRWRLSPNPCKRPAMPTFLVIDDQPEARTYVIEALKQPFPTAQFFEATSGYEGLAMAEKIRGEIDLVLLDVSMPHIDGVSVCEILKGADHTRSIPVIMMSAISHQAGERAQAIEAGAAAFLSKPFHAAELASLVRLALPLTPNTSAPTPSSATASEPPEEIQQRLHVAQKMDAIGRFIGGVAHDFNNLLTSVIGHGYLMRDSLPDDEALHADLDQIVASAEKAADLNRRLQAFGKRPASDPLPFNLSRTVEDMSELLRRIVPASIEMTFLVDDTLPAALGDQGAAEQILVNLVANSVDAMPQGGRIELEVTEEANGLRLSVHDNGEGMTPETLKQAPVPFFTTHSPVGHGMGLSVVSELAIAGGASLVLRSQPGEGTTASVTFPLADLSEWNSPTAESPTPPPPATNVHILLIDDDARVRLVTERLLDKLGHKVTSCNGAADAINACENATSPFDLALCDIVLPLLSGPSLVERLREISPELPAIFITGYPDISSMGAQEKSTDPILRKPFSINDLKYAISDSLA